MMAREQTLLTLTRAHKTHKIHKVEHKQEILPQGCRQLQLLVRSRYLHYLELQEITHSYLYFLENLEVQALTKVEKLWVMVLMCQDHLQALSSMALILRQAQERLHWLQAFTLQPQQVQQVHPQSTGPSPMQERGSSYQIVQGPQTLGVKISQICNRLIILDKWLKLKQMAFLEDNR